MNPKKMQEAMKQMGIDQEEIHAKRVVIEKENSSIIIENPSVTKIKVQGTESFQISGDVKEEIKSESSLEEKAGLVEKKENNPKVKKEKTAKKTSPKK